MKIRRQTSGADLWIVLCVVSFIFQQVWPVPYHYIKRMASRITWGECLLL